MVRMLPLLALIACAGGPDTGETDGDCDCPGAEGLPNVLGFWTGEFASVDYMFQETCDITGLDEDSEKAWLDTAFEIDGYGPNKFEMILSGDEDVELNGILEKTGGMVFSGNRSDSLGEMSVAISGLVYNDIYRNRMVWEGMVYIGIDTLGDGEIDCYARGDWTAMKSGG